MLCDIYMLKFKIMVTPRFTMGNTLGGERFLKMWNQTQLLPCHRPLILVMPKPLDFTLHLFSIETKAIIFYDNNWHTKKV